MPRADLSDNLRDALQLLPCGVVDQTGSEVVRRVASPVRVQRMLVRNSSWREGLRRAGAFAAFAERIMVLNGACAERLSQRLWEADAVGVGVWVARPDGGVDEVLAPAR